VYRSIRWVIKVAQYYRFVWVIVGKKHFWNFTCDLYFIHIPTYVQRGISSFELYNLSLTHFTHQIWILVEIPEREINLPIENWSYIGRLAYILKIIELQNYKTRISQAKRFLYSLSEIQLNILFRELKRYWNTDYSIL